jgi:hypothetical protein
MAKTMVLFRDSRASSLLSGSWTDVPAEPPSHKTCPRIDMSPHSDTINLILSQPVFALSP